MYLQQLPYEPVNDSDVAALRKSGKIAAIILREMVEYVKPGISTAQLDRFAGKLMQLHRVKSAPLMEGFPGNTCLSVNEVIAHGVPTTRKLCVNDRINIDVSIEYNGYFGDVACTVILGANGHLSSPLLECAQKATMDALLMSKAGTAFNEIGRMIEDLAKSRGFSIIRNLCSHGVGKTLHAHPSNILNYYDPEEKLVLENGMVIAWEPFVSAGACRAIEMDGEWNLTTHNKSHVAQFEHTVLVTGDRPEILTLLD